MIEVKPSVFLVAETRYIDYQVQAYLKHVGAKSWTSNAHSQAEHLIEIMGRSCYRSFGTELNKNITKVREDNYEYIQHIISVGHGSVLEHSSVSFMLCDVSRVFTHELVRHRVGCAISQESLRFVRLDKLKCWAPTVIAENKYAMSIIVSAFEAAEAAYEALEEILIKPDMKFAEKKVITSAMRRIAPIGLATNIGWTSNFRTLRHLIEMRTDPSAEEEIRIVFAMIAETVCNRYPAVFGDYKVEIVNGIPWYHTEHRKV
ncbi:MAG: FAD-dependent thymidylate synthase [Nitrosopumilus sp.]